MDTSQRVKRLILVPVAALLALSMTACGADVPSDFIAVHMGEGPFEDKKPKGCKDPGTHENTVANDDYRLYPISEREWDATGQDGSDGSPFKSITDDNVEMAIPVTVRFTLITECTTITEFHLKYGRRYGVEFESDGKYNDEWVKLLRKLIADPGDATLDRIVQDYKWRDVWNNPETKAEIEKRMNEEILKLVDRQAKGTFFEGITVLVGKPEPANAALKDAVAQEQNLVAKAQAEEAQAKADKARAEAQLAVSQAEAAKKNAEIRGYGSVESYLRALCIQQGCNPFQPTYLVGAPAR